MNEDRFFSLAAKSAFSVTLRGGSDKASVVEDRLLRGARLRTSGGPGEGTHSFHVRIEDLLAQTGRRGTPRR